MSSKKFPKIAPDEYHLIQAHFEPRSLTLARELRGLTKAQLAERVNKTPGAISQFEAGYPRPDVKTIKLLAFSLGVPANFFMRRVSDELISIENCHFRSLRSATQKSRRQVLAKAKILHELLMVLEDYIDFPPETLSSLSQSLSSLGTNIEEYALRVREAWQLGLGPIDNMVNLLENQGVIVCDIPEENVKVDAFSFWKAHRPYIYLTSARGSNSRRRFDCAHELGHLLLHADVAPGNRLQENEADRFAAAFLFPSQVFIQESPKRVNFDHFYELKRRWKISVAALIYRAHELGCISEYAYRRAYVELNRRGERYSEPYEPEREEPNLLRDALQLLEEDASIISVANELNISVREIYALSA